MSCSHNPDNFYNVGKWTATNLKKTVSHNPQWGRTYESMGQEDNYIELYAKSYVKGLQDVSSGKIRGVLGSVKHFIGDGSTKYGANEGSSTVLNFKNYI